MDASQFRCYVAVAPGTGREVRFIADPDDKIVGVKVDGRTVRFELTDTLNPERFTLLLVPWATGLPDHECTGSYGRAPSGVGRTEMCSGAGLNPDHQAGVPPDRAMRRALALAAVRAVVVGLPGRG